MLKTKKLLSIVLLSLVAASGIFAAEPVKEVKDGYAKNFLIKNGYDLHGLELLVLL